MAQANRDKIQRLCNQHMPPSRPKEDFRLIRPNLYVPQSDPSIPRIQANTEGAETNR